MSEMIDVRLGARSYDIHIGSRLLKRAGELIAPFAPEKRAFVVTDANVARFYLHNLTASFNDAGIRAIPVVLPAGEGTKNFSQLEALLETLLEHTPTRKSLIVALGGGVIGDIAGFAASILLRGIDFVQIPTTLLAQVDSSIGGKTAVNSRHGKNLIGHFHQPRLVLADTDTLSTLPAREMKSGYAEVMKYGLIDRPEFFGWLEQNAPALLAGDSALITHAVMESCRAKADIVGRDETEQGDRALLNLGHTFAHALEAETGYSSTLLHGEAVGIGMHLAYRLSAQLSLCAEADAERVARHLKAVGLPFTPRDIRPNWDIDALMHHFTRDKKAGHHSLTFILARGIGKAFVAKDVSANAVRSILEKTLGS